MLKLNTSVAGIERRFSILRTAISVTIALAVALALIAIVSDSPLKDFTTFVLGPLQSVNRLSIIIEKMIPLLFTGTAVCIMYSCNQINLSAEGAFFAGTFTATAIGILPGIPTGLHFALCALAAAAAGAVISGIPGIMHVKKGVMTVVSSLMINYVSLYIGLYLMLNVLLDPAAGFAGSFPFAESAKLPIIIPGTKVHFGLILGIAVVVIAYVILYKTKYGYQIRTIGSNREFALYSGIPVGATIISCQLLAGAIAGLGGATEVLALYSRFSYGGLTNHGWDGVMLAILARNNPKAIPFAALFLAYIRTGADVLNRMSNIPTEVVKIVQAIVIVLVCAEGLLRKSEYRAIVKHSQRAELSKEA